jgi:nitroimidazol reductase NimA-like FMN-containing flavoprotein (pyridoxamine 5'-phosphate oxidase superfamily)
MCCHIELFVLAHYFQALKEIAVPSPDAAPSPRTRLRRGADRGDYAPDTVRAILDAGSLCHLGFTHEGKPGIIPTFYGVMGDEIVVHGSTANRALRTLADGGEACIVVSLVDGLVLARSAFHHSMNYRSVVIYGRARALEDPEEKLEALRVMIEKLVPGRWEDVRGPNREEFARTLVLAVPLDEASAKIRRGPPVDDDEDYALDCWAGVLPVRTQVDKPVDDPRLPESMAVPGYIDEFLRRNP